MHAYVDFKRIVNVEARVNCYPISMVDDLFTILASREVIYEFNLNFCLAYQPSQYTVTTWSVSWAGIYRHLRRIREYLATLGLLHPL